MDGIFGRDKEARGDSAQRRAATAVLLVDFREMGGLSCLYPAIISIECFLSLSRENKRSRCP